MNIQQAIELLTNHQKWRLGNDDIPMQIPSEITEALNVLLEYNTSALELLSKYITSSQTEISDDEIEKCIGDGMHDFYKGGFFEGAKWYREQLKKK